MQRLWATLVSATLLLVATEASGQGAGRPPSAAVYGDGRRGGGADQRLVVTPEDFGASGDGTTDDRVKINRAADEACRRGGLLLLRRRYAVWDDARSSDPANNHAYDGQHILLGCGGGRPVAVEMLAGSALLMKGLDGVDPATHWQAVHSARYGGPAVWRGSGIFIRGGRSAAAAPGPVTIRCTGRPGSCLIDGGSGAGTRVYTIPASPATGDGWDITQKGVQQENDAFHGDLTLDGLEIRGFKGELQYQSGHHNGALTVRNCYLHDGNGDGLNPSDPTTLQVDHVQINNVFQWIEGTAGYNSVVRNVTSNDTPSGGTLAGGSFGDITTVNGFKYGGNGVTLVRKGQGTPWLTLHKVTIQNATRNAFLVGSYIRGDIALIDSAIGLSAGGRGSPWSNITNVDLEITAHADNATLGNVFYINGGPVGPQYVDTIDDVRITAHAEATPAGRAGGHVWSMPFAWGGGIGPHVVIENSSFEAKRYPSATFKTDRFPLQRNNSYVWRGDASGSYARVDKDAVVSPTSEVFFLASAPGGPHSIGLTTSGYAVGQRIRLLAKDLHGAITLRGAGMAPGEGGQAPRLTHDGQEIDVRFDARAGVWRGANAAPDAGNTP